MKKICLLLYSSLVFSQVKVVDSIGQPIEGVIVSQSKIVKTITNRLGIFEIPKLNTKDSISLTYIGYKKRMIAFNEIYHQKIIVLEYSTEQLAEIKIGLKPRKKILFPDKSLTDFTMINRGGKPDYSTYSALFVPFNKEYDMFYINKIIIPTMRGYWDKTDSAKYSPFKVALYAVDKNTKLPSSNIIGTNYAVFRNKSDTQVEVILTEKFDFPQEGIYIVVETFDSTTVAERPVFKRVLRNKKSKFNSFYKFKDESLGRLSNWFDVRQMNINANYYFGLELVSYRTN